MPKRKPRQVPHSTRDPDPSAEFVTVAWMLSVMTALVCELGFVAARGYLLLVNAEAPTFQVLAAMLLFASLVIGLVSLGLMVLVVRMRQVAPPRGILTFAAVVAVAPMAAMLLRVLSGDVMPTP
jgi:hypothetical protein